jgi:hypothetical protein
LTAGAGALPSCCTSTGEPVDNNVATRNGPDPPEEPPIENKCESRNALADLEQQEAVIARAGVDPFLALFAVDMAKRGHNVFPALYPGGHTCIVLADGRRMSLAEFCARARATIWESATCSRCGRWLGLAKLGRRYRVDTRYCSSACRQAAYRVRRRLSAGLDTTKMA